MRREREREVGRAISRTWMGEDCGWGLEPVGRLYRYSFGNGETRECFK